MKNFLLLMVCLWAVPSFSQSPVQAAFDLNNTQAYLCLHNGVILYDFIEQKTIQQWASLQEAFPQLPFKEIDAAQFVGNGQVYFFSEGQYTAYDLSAKRVIWDAPLTVAEDWGGLGGQALDAVLNWGTKLYFFRGNQYYRFDFEANQVDDGYPKRISDITWPGLGEGPIDAAFSLNGKSYFIRGKNYYRYDIATDRCDPGYPQSLFSLPHSDGLADALLALGPSDEADMVDFGIDIAVIPLAKPELRFREFEIDLSPYVVEAPHHILPKYWAKADGKGAFFLAFQMKQDLILMKLNSEYQRVDEPMVLRNSHYSDMLPLANGGLVVLIGRSVNNTYLEDYPNQVRLVGLSPQGAIQFDQKIFGGEGHAAGQSWFDGRSQGLLRSNGTEYGIYIPVQKNWAEPGQRTDIHDGDAFYVTDLQGRIKEDRTQFWTASHSNTLQMVTGSHDHFYTMTIGDAYPFGLQWVDRNEGKSHVVWPPEEDRISYAECNSVNAAGILEYMDTRGNNFVAILGTTEHPNIGIFDKVDPLFLMVNEEGEVLRKRWIEQDPNFDASSISVVEPNSSYIMAYIVAYGGGNDFDQDYAAKPFKLAFLDEEGDLYWEPFLIDKPFGTSSQLVAMPGSRLIWLECHRNGSSTLTLHEIRY